MKNLLPLLLICSLSGCASLSQSISTADGDTYSSKGSSLFSKQEVQAKGNLVIYPNNSGLEFTVGNSGKQDSTEAIALLQNLMSLLQALSSVGAGVDPPSLQTSPPAPAPFTLTLPTLEVPR